MTRKSRVLVTSLLAGLCLSVTGVMSVSYPVSIADDTETNPRPGLQVTSESAGNIQHVAKTLSPSVVKIVVIREAPRKEYRKPVAPPAPEATYTFPAPPTPEATDTFPSPNPTRPIIPAISKDTQGTGVIITDKGHILTSNDVLSDGDEFQVVLADERSFSAKLIGADPETGLAVLKIEGKKFVSAKFGKSNNVKLGEWVVTLGQLPDFGLCIRVGLISANPPTVDTPVVRQRLLVDSAISAGHLGGPVVNLEGKIVGISIAKSDSNHGFGLVIPANLAERVSQSLIKHGRVVQGRIGAAIQELSTGLADSFNFKDGPAVLVGDVLPGSPAEKAGLKSGDIIVEFQGRQMTTPTQFRESVAATLPGSEAKVKLVRDGKEKTVDVVIGIADPETPTAIVEPEADTKQERQEIGMTLVPLDPATAQRLGYRGNQKGVRVTQVVPNSMPAQEEIEPGDIITEVNGQAITSFEAFETIMSKVDYSKGVRFKVMRDGISRFVFFRFVA